MQVFWNMSKPNPPSNSGANEVGAIDAAPVATDTPEQPASELEVNTGTVGEQEERQDRQKDSRTSAASPPRFVFNNNTVRTTWRTQVAEGNNHIRFMVERDGFPNGAIICDHVDADVLFKAVPALRNRLEGRQIFLPAAAWLDDETVESLVYDIVRCAKEGTPIPVPDHVMKNPVRMIMMHCVLVFFDMEKQAAEFKEALWNLFAWVKLTPMDVLWIWDTFSGRVHSGSYAAPFADEYLQMMAWRILTLDAKLELDLDIRRLIELEKEPKHLTEILETRFRTCGLGRSSDAPEASAHPAVEPAQHPPTPTPPIKKALTPGAPSNGSGAANVEQVTRSQSQQSLGPTTAAADKDTKAGTKRPNASDDKNEDRKRLMMMMGKSVSLPPSAPRAWGSGYEDRLKPPVASSKVSLSATAGAQGIFGGNDPRQTANAASTATNQTISPGASDAIPSKSSIFGQSAPSPSKKSVPPAPTSDKKPDPFAPSSMAKPISSAPAPTDPFKLFLPPKEATKQSNAVVTNVNDSPFSHSDTFQPPSSAATTHVQPGTPFNPSTGGSAQQVIQKNNGNTFGDTSGFSQTARRGLFGGPASSAPQASTSSVAPWPSSQGFGTFGAPPNAPAVMGATQGPSVFSTPQLPATNTAIFSSSMDFNFTAQSGVGPSSNPVSGAANNTGAGNFAFNFQGTPGGSTTASGAAGTPNKRRIIKRPTGVRRR